MNAYESAAQKIIPAVLLYAFAHDSVLMVHGKKWNGLGGKLEVGETPVQAATREFFEEALTLVPTDQWFWSGQLYFPNFKASKHEDWWVNVYSTELTAAQIKTIPSENAEGSLHFIKKEKIIELNLWDGDRHFLPHVLEKRPFQGTFFYQDGTCIKHELALTNNQAL